MLIKTIADLRKAMRVGPYAWPGGYETFFVFTDGETLCFKCATAERRLLLEALRDASMIRNGNGWLLAAFQSCADDDGRIECCHCNTVVQVEWDAPVMTREDAREAHAEVRADLVREGDAS